MNGIFHYLGGNVYKESNAVRTHSVGVKAAVLRPRPGVVGFYRDKKVFYRILERIYQLDRFSIEVGQKEPPRA